MLERANLAGALVAVAMYALCIVVFVSRLAGRPGAGHAAGWLQFVLAVPLVVLLVLAPRLERHWLYYVQVGLMLAFLAVEFVLDYALKVDFRATRAACSAWRPSPGAAGASRAASCSSPWRFSPSCRGA